MRKIIQIIILYLFLIIWWACRPSAVDLGNDSLASENGIYLKDSTIILQNDLVSINIDQYGGHFTDLKLHSNPINPLNWELTAKQMPPNNQKGAPFKGHFLCLGRWGSPSEGEIAAGIPHNGEQTNTLWHISSISDSKVHMENEAPLDGLSVKREVNLLSRSSSFIVKETFTNVHSLGRVSNVVQHVTLGPPFLSTQTIFNSNAKKGFNQKFSYPNPQAYEYDWPFAMVDTAENRMIDLRKNDIPENYVSTHLFDASDKFGWICAYDPKSGILLAYIWKLNEYPWINIWSHFSEGKAVAKGLEFGTTGIGRPYQSLLEVDTRFHGINSWEYMDAGEKKVKSYLCFMEHIGPEKANPYLTVDKTEIVLNNRKIMDNPL